MVRVRRWDLKIWKLCIHRRSKSSLGLGPANAHRKNAKIARSKRKPPAGLSLHPLTCQVHLSPSSRRSSNARSVGVLYYSKVAVTGSMLLLVKNRVKFLAQPNLNFALQDAIIRMASWQKMLRYGCRNYLHYGVNLVLLGAAERIVSTYVVL